MSKSFKYLTSGFVFLFVIWALGRSILKSNQIPASTYDKSNSESSKQWEPQFITKDQAIAECEAQESIKAEAYRYRISTRNLVTNQEVEDHLFTYFIGNSFNGHKLIEKSILYWSGTASVIGSEAPLERLSLSLSQGSEAVTRCFQFILQVEEKSSSEWRKSGLYNVGALPLLLEWNKATEANLENDTQEQIFSNLKKYQWSKSAVLEGNLRLATYMDCCTYGNEIKTPYFSLQLTQPIQMLPTKDDDLEPFMNKVEVVQLDQLVNGNLKSLLPNSKLTVECASFTYGINGHYALPVMCVNPKLLSQ